MIYITYNPETGAVGENAYSKLEMVPEYANFMAISVADWMAADGKVKVVENGKFTWREPEKTPEEIVKEYEDAVQSHLDATAQSKGYDNTYTCLSYLSSTDETWQRESNIFNAWRDTVWRKCHEVLNAVIAGEIQPPTVDELISQLPKIEW